jgi:hypothetical protein
MLFLRGCARMVLGTRGMETNERQAYQQKSKYPVHAEFFSILKER